MRLEALPQVIEYNVYVHLLSCIHTHHCLACYVTSPCKVYPAPCLSNSAQTADVTASHEHNADNQEGMLSMHYAESSWVS